MDIYVYKVPFTKDAVTGKYSATGAAVRTPVMNVPFSQFKADATYLGPWVSVSITLPQMLTLLGLPPASDASYKTSGSTNPLLTIYKLGINMDTDLNLVSGSKILAADIVAAGLFQSNQFYPAMKLTWTVTDYCPFIAGSWTGSWIGTEVFASSSGDDDIQLFQDATNPNKYVISNFWGLAGCGGPTLTAFIIFSPSTNPSTQTLTMPSQSDGQSTAGTISGTAGKYNQCTQTFSVQVTYVQNVNFTSCQTPAGTYKWRYDFHRP